MRNLIDKFGRSGILILITLLSIIASVVITTVLYEISEKDITSTEIVISILAPMLIAPSIGWFVVSLLIKIHKLEEVQRNLVAYDVLTGLLTRRVFFEKFDTLYQSISKKESTLSLAYIDIDNFKKINDKYGHAGGDVVLKVFSSILSSNINEDDLLGRIGGEEFAIVLPETDLKKAMSILEEIRLSLKKSKINFHSKTIELTVSIGVVVFDKNNRMDLDTLCIQSDHALYKAKKSG